ncbi:MAG: hypothetical protein HWN68_08270 [Desulfobacterales bacterium]|nr:hypothetical protein [Desulfobacterales bacterium]
MNRQGFCWTELALAFSLMILCVRSYRISIDEYAIADPALSLLLEGNVDVDEYPELHHVSFMRDGHYYPWCTPFFGLLFAPFYLVGNPYGYGHVLETIPSILAIIGSMVLVHRKLKCFGVKECVAKFSGWNFAFGTVTLFYCMTILRHPVAGFVALAVYCGLSSETPKWKLALLGVLAGSLVLINEFFLGVLAFFAVFSPLLLENRKRWLAYVLGMVPPLLLFSAYNQLIIGNAFVTTRMLEPRTASWFTGQPSLVRALAQLYSPRCGLFVFTPLFILPIVAFFVSFKAKKGGKVGGLKDVARYVLRFKHQVFLTGWIATLLLSASTFTLIAGDFAWGPRLVTEVCAPFAILTGLALDKIRSWKGKLLVSVLFVWGVFLNVVGVLTEQWMFYFTADKRGLLGVYYYDVNPFYPVWQYPHSVWLFTLREFFRNPTSYSWFAIIPQTALMSFFVVLVPAITIGLAFLWAKQ